MKTIEEGRLRGAFKGFHDRHTVFEFVGGGTWKQNEYKYHYHYTYMPDAKVVDERGTYVLHVDGVSETVEVIRV